MTKFTKYEKYGSAPIVFTEEERREEWEAIDADLKNWIKNNLLASCEKMSTQHSIETLCHVINDLSKRIDELEKSK